MLKIWTGAFVSVTTGWDDRGKKERGNSYHSYPRLLATDRGLIVHIITINLANSAAAMTQNHEENPQRTRAGVHHIQARMQHQSRLALKRVRKIQKDDIKGFFLRNAFVLFTVSAVVIGEWKRIFFLLLFRRWSELHNSISVKWQIPRDMIVWENTEISSPAWIWPLTCYH